MNKAERTFAACSTALFTILVVACSRPLDAAPSAAPGDAVRGKAVFERRCTGCHALDRNREGPRLADVYGRKSRTVPDFPYLAELKQAGIVWDAKSLDAWLTDPDAVVPGNNMSFHVAKAEERRDLIAYLKASGKMPINAEGN